MKITKPNLRFTSIATVTKHIVAGVAGWQDTNCSAELGTNPERIFICSSISSATVVQGARQKGVVLDTSQNTQYFTQFVNVDATGHIEFYRNAAQDAYYTITGYLDG